MNSRRCILVLGVVWVASLWAVLQLNRIPALASNHALCGRWGCGPSLGAILAWHGFATLLLAYPALLVRKAVSDRVRTTLGWTAAAAAAGGLLGLFGEQVAIWYPLVGTDDVTVYLSATLLAVAMAVNLPIAPLAAASGMLLLSPPKGSQTRTRPIDAKYADASVPTDLP